MTQCDQVRSALPVPFAKLVISPLERKREKRKKTNGRSREPKKEGGGSPKGSRQGERPRSRVTFHQKKEKKGEEGDELQKDTFWGNREKGGKKKKRGGGGGGEKRRRKKERG